MPPDPVKTRQRILEAFEATYGPDGPADIDVVAAAAGVSRSTVYRHFAHAGEMLEAARQQGFAAGTRLVERYLAAALRGESGADILEGVAQLIDAVFREGIAFARLLRLDAGADAAIHAHYQRLASEVIRKAQRDGQVAPHLDPGAIYVGCVSLFRGLLAAVDDGALSPADASAMSSTFLQALRP